MGNVMAYSGITTKIRAMQAKLLTDQDFEKIAGFHSTREIIEYLKGKPAYSKYMNQLDASLYHRSDVEKILTQSLFDDYTRIFRFAGMEQKKFLKIYWKRYEIDVINYCLRIVFNHYQRPFDLDYKKQVFDRYSKISIDKLMTSKNIDDLVENLKGTEYYAPLHKVQRSDGGTLLDYDRALDLYYFDSYWKKGRKIFHGDDRKRFLREIGMKMDMLNLQWIYRAKKYYRMTPAEIYTLTIPYHYHISVDEFKTLVEASTPEEFGRHMMNTYYGKHYDIADNSTREKKMTEVLRKINLSDRRENPYSNASLHAYLFLKEEETKRLTTAFECIRYGMTRGETLSYIGGVNR